MNSNIISEIQSRENHRTTVSKAKRFPSLRIPTPSFKNDLIAIFQKDKPIALQDTQLILRKCPLK